MAKYRVVNCAIKFRGKFYPVDSVLESDPTAVIDEIVANYLELIPSVTRKKSEKSDNNESLELPL